MTITQQAKQLYGAYSPSKKQSSDEKPQIEGAVISRKPLLFIDVDIGENEQDRITVFQGDDPRALAQKFCLKHSIDDAEIVTVLEQQLLQKMLQQTLQQLLQQTL